MQKRQSLFKVKPRGQIGKAITRWPTVILSVNYGYCNLINIVEGFDHRFVLLSNALLNFQDRELLLTSSSSALPPCALWTFGDVFEMK